VKKELTTKKVISLVVNGETKEVMIRSADILLHTLRNQLGLTGAKSACENGDCGACTILLDREPIHACLCLTIEALNSAITTIEGITDSPIQQKFVEKWAIQCGYCTPGLIMKSYALAKNHPQADEDTIEEWLSSNLCRCTGYQEIKDAVQAILEDGLA
jgi:aerobic carbon-monoxide dehydrogenase small subunit